jgi:hypothetical protein
MDGTHDVATCFPILFKATLPMEEAAAMLFLGRLPPTSWTSAIMVRDRGRVLPGNGQSKDPRTGANHVGNLAA